MSVTTKFPDACVRRGGCPAGDGHFSSIFFLEPVSDKVMMQQVAYIYYLVACMIS